MAKELPETLGFVIRESRPPPFLKADIVFMLILTDLTVHLAIARLSLEYSSTSAVRSSLLISGSKKVSALTGKRHVGSQSR